MNNGMIIEILKDEWTKIEFGELNIGDRFRMRYPETGELFVGDNGESEFVTISEPYLNEHKIPTVNIEG